MKKIICALMAISMLFCLCACGHSPASGEQFTTVLSGKGLQVEDLGASGMDSVTGCHVAYNEDMSIVIFFYETRSEADAQQAYLGAKDSFDELSGTSTSTTAGSYARATKSAGDVYYIVAYSGATLMYGETSKDHADEIKDLFKALGY